jgi:hypothetical protein
VSLLSPNGLTLGRRAFVVTFKDRRVGRCYNVSPLQTRATDADDLAEKIWYHVAPCLVSGRADIQVDLVNKSGVIFEGLMTVAKFTINEVGHASR